MVAPQSPRLRSASVAQAGYCRLHRCRPRAITTPPILQRRQAADNTAVRLLVRRLNNLGFALRLALKRASDSCADQVARHVRDARAGLILHKCLSPMPE